MRCCRSPGLSHTQMRRPTTAASKRQDGTGKVHWAAEARARPRQTPASHTSGVAARMQAKRNGYPPSWH